MKKICVICLLVLMLTMLPAVKPVSAAAYGTNFVSSITYQNVGSGDAVVTINFYSQMSPVPVTITRPNLAPMAASSVYVGGLTSISAGFLGSAVMSSNQPLVATLVQNATAIKARPLTNAASAGASYVQIPTAVKDTFGKTTTFSVQNVDSVDNDVILTFVPVGGGAPLVLNVTIPSGSSKYYDLGKMTEITSASYNSSVNLRATKTGTTTPGSIVASALEAQTVGNFAAGFEGSVSSSKTVYMPSALCNYGPYNNFSSAYAVQNVGTTSTNVSVKYANATQTFIDGPYPLLPGAKKSFNACSANVGTGFLGSAIVQSDTENIVAMGQVYGGSLFTAYLGFNNGSSKIALPFVRWTEAHWVDGTRSRAYIAIQNVALTDLAAGTVSVKYYNSIGTLVGTHTLGAIPAGMKANSDASKIPGMPEFGYNTDGTIGGGVIVEGPTGAQLAVIVRVQTNTGTGDTTGEDYNGIPIQ